MSAPVTRTATIDAQLFADCGGCGYPVEVSDTEARGLAPTYCLLCLAMGLGDDDAARDAAKEE